MTWHIFRLGVFVFRLQELTLGQLAAGADDVQYNTIQYVIILPFHRGAVSEETTYLRGSITVVGRSPTWLSVANSAVRPIMRARFVAPAAFRGMPWWECNVRIASRHEWFICQCAACATQNICMSN